jgi:chemotaxis protein MotB
MEEPPPKEKKVPEELTCPEWMMTMGDCMSLLLTFFVLLLTFSTTSKSKLMDVIGVMKGAFSFVKAEMVKDETAYNEGSFEDGEDRKVYNRDGSSNMRLNTSSILRLKKVMEENLDEVGFKYPLEIKKLDQGFAIDVAVEDIFLAGTTKLSFKGKKVVNEVGNIAKSLLTEIRITSFMNKRAVSKRFNNDWKEGVERNMALARILRDEFDIRESRFSTAINILKGSTTAENVNKVKIMFVEKLNVNEMSIGEFLNGSN